MFWFVFFVLSQISDFIPWPFLQKSFRKYKLRNVENIFCFHVVTQIYDCIHFPSHFLFKSLYKTKNWKNKHNFISFHFIHFSWIFEFGPSHLGKISQTTFIFCCNPNLWLHWTYISFPFQILTELGPPINNTRKFLKLGSKFTW